MVVPNEKVVTNTVFNRSTGDQNAPVACSVWLPRDGDIENGIIFHEYGHGLSNRLTGGPAVNCLSGNEQAGEGWSDYIAISTMLDPTLDDPAGPRGMGPYALFQPNRQGNGIRPRPYTRNMAILATKKSTAQVPGQGP